jgi:hypothetical protein
MDLGTARPSLFQQEEWFAVYKGVFMKGQKSNSFYPSGPRDNPAAVLGHELGNVLNGLLGMAEILGETHLSSEQSQWLDAIVQSGRQMQALIQSEWRWFHRHALNPEPSPVLVDGLRLMERVLTSHIPAARFSNNCLFLSMKPEVPGFWDCDPRMVRQLLDNVLGNAIKFTRSGDIHVEVLARLQKGTLLIRVSDTGPGFGRKRCGPPGVAERGESVNGGEGSGNQGLGLQICQQIVNALNGELSITSPRGTGTQIEITLPGVLKDPEHYPRLECSLFRLIRCRLELANPLMAVVRNMLDRLGVAWTRGETGRSGECLFIELSEHHRGPGRGDRVLLLRPVTACGPEIESRTIALPLLESSLGSLLLEMALTWRTRLLRSDSPGSTREQRQPGRTGFQDPRRE